MLHDRITELVAATPAAANTTAAETAFPGEVCVLSHGSVEGVKIPGHAQTGKVPAFIWLHSHQLLRATAQAQPDKDERNDKEGASHDQEGGSGLTFFGKKGLDLGYVFRPCLGATKPLVDVTDDSLAINDVAHWHRWKIKRGSGLMR